MRLLAIAILLVACGKGDKGGGPRDKVLDAWKSGGLAPTSFTSAQTPVGSDCATGMVAGLDVMLCVFQTPAQAAAAEEAGYNWVGGATTGSVQAKGVVLVA